MMMMMMIVDRDNPYTCVIAGQNVRTSKTPVSTLMWTSATVPDVGEPLKVNHVVWLAERQQPEVEVVDEGSYDTRSFPPYNVSSSPQNDAMTDVVDTDDSDTKVSLSDDDGADDAEDADAALPNKEGLSTLEVINLLTADADHLPGPILASISHGEKNN